MDPLFQYGIQIIQIFRIVSCSFLVYLSKDRFTEAKFE